MKYVLYILMVVLFSACEELESDIDIKPGESKLVLNAYLTPNDSVVKVHLTQTIPLLGEGIDPNINNAIITITDGTTTDTFYYETNEMLYLLNKTLESDKTYTIKAVTMDGRWVEASTTIPKQANLDFTYNIDSIITNDKIEYIVTLDWTDVNVNENVYYRTDAELYYVIIDTLTGNFQLITKELLSNTSEIMKPVGNGQNMRIVYKSDKELRNIMKYLELHMLMVDEEYYRFELEKKNNYSGFPNYEYTRLYSNVRNGFGIVASYNNYVLKPLNIN